MEDDERAARAGSAGRGGSAERRGADTQPANEAGAAGGRSAGAPAARAGAPTDRASTGGESGPAGPAEPADPPAAGAPAGADPAAEAGPNAYARRQRELRLARRLSVRQLAELTGLAFGYLARVERGEDAPPGEAAIVKIAAALGVPEDELLALARRPHPDVLRAVSELPPEGRLFLRRAANRQLSPAEWRRLADLIDRPS